MTEEKKDNLSKDQKAQSSAPVESKPAGPEKTAPKASAPEQKAEVKAGEKTPNSEPKTEVKAEEKVSAPEAKTEVKAGEKTPNSEPKTEVKAEEKVSAPEAKTEVKAEEKVSAPEAKTEEQTPAPSAKENTQKEDNSAQLEGLFAFKMSMSTFYNEQGESIPVTALKYEPCFVSQIKTQDKDSYSAVQVAFKAQKNKRCSKALITHLKPAGFKEGARFVKEVRQDVSENLKPGQPVSIHSLKKGDLLKITSLSKGRGFAGVMKKWNFAGGRASHGSKSHRRTGSIGQHTEPARVMPGRKMPGQYGFKKVSRLKVPVVDIFPEENIIFVKGPVPGARNTLVSLRKMSL